MLQHTASTSSSTGSGGEFFIPSEDRSESPGDYANHHLPESLPESRPNFFYEPGGFSPNSPAYGGGCSLLGGSLEAGEEQSFISQNFFKNLTPESGLEVGAGDLRHQSSAAGAVGGSHFGQQMEISEVVGGDHHAAGHGGGGSSSFLEIVTNSSAEAGLHPPAPIGFKGRTYHGAAGIGPHGPPLPHIVQSSPLPHIVGAPHIAPQQEVVVHPSALEEPPRSSCPARMILGKTEKRISMITLPPTSQQTNSSTNQRGSSSTAPDEPSLKTTSHHGGPSSSVAALPAKLTNLNPK